MVQKNLELCGLIYGKYNSVADFARKIGMSRQRLQTIVSGRTDPSIQDVYEIANALDRSISDIMDIFLRFKSTKVVNSQQNKEDT